MALKSATSVPGLSARCRSAARAVTVARGSTTMSLSCGFFARASSMRRQSTGCAKAVLEPAISIRSAASMSS